jgi:outer membrane protein assembly factor BamB
MRHGIYRGLSTGACVCVLTALVALLVTAAERNASEKSGGVSVPSTTENWSMFRGDPQSTGVSAGTLPAQMDVLWKFSLPESAFEATAVIDGGLVFVGDLDGGFHALDFDTGEEKWSHKGEAGFRAPAGVRDGSVYVGDEDGQFHCFNAADGALKWGFRTNSEINGGPGFYNDTVLVGSQDATLYCLNAADGALVWKHTISDQIRCTPTVVENRCFLAGCDGELHIIDLDSGTEVSSVKIDAPTGCTPAAVGERIYFGTEGEEFFCVDWREAQVEWRFRSDKHLPFRSSAAATEKQVVFGGRDKFVHCLNPANGDVIWSYPAKSAVDSSPVIVGDRAYVGLGKGRLVALDLATGEEAWNYEAGGGFISSPAVAAGRLVIANEDGTVYCFGEKK